MNPMKKQWQQWIRMRSKIHGAQAKPILPIMDDNSSISQTKTVLPKTAETEEKGAGPKGGLNTESQSYYESVVQSNTNRLVSLKKEHMENGDQKLKFTAERTVDRLAMSLPDHLRKTVVTCQQAYRIIVCLAYFQVQEYPVKLIENILEVITSRSYSLPANRVHQFLTSVSALKPANVKTILREFAPRMLQVVHELTPTEIASIVALYGHNHVFVQALTNTLFETFMESAAESSLRDYARVLNGLHQVEYDQKQTLLALLAERTSQTLKDMLESPEAIFAEDVVLILRSAAYFEVNYVPLYATCCAFVQLNIDTLTTEHLIDVVCSLQDTVFADAQEVVYIIKHIQRRAEKDLAAMSAMKSVVLWTQMLQANNLTSEYSFFAKRALGNIPLLSHTELSQGFVLLASSITKHTQHNGLYFFRLNCSMNQVVNDMIRRLMAVPEGSISPALALNVLASLAKLDYLQSNQSTPVNIAFSEESIANRISYVGKVLGFLHKRGIKQKTTAETPTKENTRKSNVAPEESTDLIDFHGERIKCIEMMEYYFNPDGVFWFDSAERKTSQVPSDFYTEMCKAIL